jgi:DNA-binding NarL/FixJ family response regulator
MKINDPKRPVRRVLLVDDHAVFRRGCRQILDEKIEGLGWVEAANITEARTALEQRPFDLMILDLSLPDGSGVHVLKEAQETCPAMPVLVLTAFTEEEFGLTAFRLGAAGFLGKQGDPGELVLAVRRILSGAKYVSPSLGERFAEALGGIGTKASVLPHKTLSPRELQVLKWVATGKSLKEIASELVLSENTVATYRSRISEKLKLSTNVELTRYALKHGLVD